MKKELEKFNKEKLMRIAKELNIYQAEKLSRKDLINHILKSSGEKFEDNKKEIKYKKTKNQVKMNIVFACILIFNFSSIIVPMINRFIFSYSGSGHFIYLTILNFVSLLWSIYIWKIWIRLGYINPFMLFSLIMTIAYDAYYLYEMHDYMMVLKILKINFDSYLKITILFYVWLSILVSSFFIGLITFLTIKRK